jgi:hypothetical protein
MEKQKKEVALDYFDRMNFITEHGSVDYAGKVEVNYSSILTKLIQETGRLCDRFASDLFINWKSVEKWIEELKEREPKKEIFAFGLRDSGVDHKEFCEVRLTNASVYGSSEFGIYRAIYVLEMQFDGSGLTMTLGKGWVQNKK